MTRQSLKHFFVAFALLSPTIALAASCQAIMNTINDDINQYGDDLKNKSLKWMNLSWLQKSLGNSDSKEIINDQTVYQWHCDHDSGMLKAATDKDGQILHLDGQYVSSTGSGLFSTDLPLFQNIAMPTPSPDGTPNLPLLLLSSTATQPEESECDQAIRQISNDITTFSSFIGNQQLPWMKLTWLNDALGTPSSMPAYAYLYQWDQYQLYIAADGNKEHLGELPNNSNSESVDEITALLGKPKQVNLEKLNQYTWRCPVNNGSALTIWMDKNNQIAHLNGKTCTVDRCKNFETEIHGTELQKSHKTKKQQLAQNSAGLSAIKLKRYNDHYKVSLETDHELGIDIEKRIKEFYANLRQCTPGVYEYAVPVSNEFLFNTTTIQKEKAENRCIVETRYAIPHIGSVTLKCRYQPDTLNLFNDNEANYIAKGHTSFNADNPSAIQLAEENECKRYINGVL